MLKKQSGAFSVFDLPEWSGVVDKDRPESVKYTQDLAGSRDHRRMELNIWLLPWLAHSLKPAL